MLLSGKQIIKSDRFQLSSYSLSDIGKELYLITNVEECDWGKLAEVFDNDNKVKIGDIMTFHNMVNEIEYNLTPFREYQKTESKNDIKQKYENLPRLSQEPNI